MAARPPLERPEHLHGSAGVAARKPPGVAERRRGGARVVVGLLTALVVEVSATATTLRCDSSTALTLVALDTRDQRVLFSLPRPASGPGWLLELDLVRDVATAWREPEAGRRFGISNGPGPPLAALRCGDQCLQPVVLRGGSWEALGEPLLAPASATAFMTWDAAGAAWVLLHGLREGGGVQILAHRLQGGDWVARGALAVKGVGSSGAGPAPPGESGVVAGDGQFLAVGEPRRWLKGNAPPLPGELFWLGGERAVYLGTDRLLRQTADGGRRWEPVRWQPPGSAVAAAGSAVQGGREVWIELPEGDRRSPLLAVWNDQRDAGAPRLIFTRRGVAGDWRVLADTAQGLLTEGGERLPYNHLLRLGDRLVLVTGCVRRAAGAAMVVRILADGPLGGPRLVAVKTVDAEEPAHP